MNIIFKQCSSRLLNTILLLCVVVFLIQFSTKKAYACDVCTAPSGAASGNGLWAMDKHYVGIQYNLSKYGFHTTGTTGLVNATDHFHTTNVEGRVVLSDRWRLAFSVPYQYNMRIISDVKSHFKGFGDGSADVMYRIAGKNADSTRKFTSGLFGIAGVNIPFGKLVSSPGVYLEQNLSPSTNALGSRLAVQAFLSNDKWQHTISVFNQLYAVNSNEFRKGTRWNTQLGTTRFLEVNNNSKLLIGGFMQHMIAGYDRQFGVRLATSGGQVTQAGGLMGFQWKQALFIAQGSIPIVQHFNLTTYEAKASVSCSIRFFIK